MSCFNLFTKSLVYQSTITASSENALFPVSNLKDERRTKVFRSNTNSDSVILDFQEASEIDSIFVLAEKRNGFGFTSVTFEFNGTSNFSSPACSVNVDFSDKHALGFAEFTKISYRFCRIVMTSTLGYCELSKVYIGTKLQTQRTIKFGWTLKEDDLSLKTTNRYGQLFSDIISTQKKIGFSFSYLDKVDLELINSIIDAHAETKPIWVRIGDSSMSDDFRRTSGAFFLNDTPQITNSHFNKYALSMSLNELL